MKHSIVKFSLFISIISTIITMGCKKDPAPPVPNTIADIVANDTSFSFLLAAAVRAGLADELGAAGTLTVFAPDNNAFRKAGFTSAAAITAADEDYVKSIVQYHVLTSKITASQVPAGPNAAVSSFGGVTLFATNNGTDVFINGVKVKKANIEADNGVVHVIGSVLLPPTGNIVQTAVANSSFTYLVAAIQRASTGAVNVAGVLSGAGPFTVFAPTNDAFIDAGFETIDEINATDPAALTPILTYHVIGARVFSSDLTNGATPGTLNGATVTIGLGSAATVKGKTNTSASNIVATDIVTTNGIIHVIDQVLLP